jgi:glycosyltransferase involved in cell wall biosynthesis
MARLAISTFAYAPSIGGVERHTRQLARALVARGHHVRVVTAHVQGTAREELDEHGVEIVRVAAGHGSRWRRMATYVAASAAALTAMRREIDVLHVQQALYPAAALTVLARALRVPIVVRNSGSGRHGAVQLMSRLPFGRASLALIGRGAAAVSLSREMTDEMRGAGFIDVTEIHNGVAIAAPLDRREARRELVLPDQARVALVVGRLDREKGTSLLAEAWRQVGGDAQLVICGDGPDAALVRGLPRVRFEGLVANLAPYYAAADVFVLPSESEGTSNALLEAMAAGRACIATAVGGNREVIDRPEVGVLVPPDDARELAHAVEELLADSARAAALGDRARAHVLANWSFEAMVDAYERLYDRLLG